MSDSPEPNSEPTDQPVYASAIEYTTSAAGRNRPGTLTYDGQRLTVTDKDGREVFAHDRSEITKISRLEWMLTIHAGKQKIYVMFGDRIKNALAGAAGGVGGLPGLVGSHFAHEHLHEVSGLTGWTQLFESQGLMGSHMSSSTPMKTYVVFPLIVTGIIVLVIVGAFVIPYL